MKTISGAEAIARMRSMRNDPGNYFILHHLTYNRKLDQTSGMRIVNKCRLRTAVPDDAFQFDQDLYLPYYDIEKDDARLCFKKLIRFVAFPPAYELLKVDWFNN